MAMAMCRGVVEQRNDASAAGFGRNETNQPDHSINGRSRNESSRLRERPSCHNITHVLYRQVGESRYRHELTGAVQPECDSMDSRMLEDVYVCLISCCPKAGVIEHPR
jgi:hypothetical protein